LRWAKTDANKMGVAETQQLLIQCQFCQLESS